MINPEKYIIAAEKIRLAFRLYAQNFGVASFKIWEKLPKEMKVQGLGLGKASFAKWFPQKAQKSTTAIVIDNQQKFERLFNLALSCVEYYSEQEIVDNQGKIITRPLNPANLSFIDAESGAFMLRSKGGQNLTERLAYEYKNPEAKRYVLFTGSVLTGISVNYVYSSADNVLSFFDTNEKSIVSGRLIMNSPTKMIIDAQDDQEDVFRVILKRDDTHLNHFYYTGSRVTLSSHLKPDDCLLVLWEKGKPIDDILNDFNLNVIKAL